MRQRHAARVQTAKRRDSQRPHGRDTPTTPPQHHHQHQHPHTTEHEDSDRITVVGMCCVEGLTASIASEVVVGPPREQAGSPGAPACSAAPPGGGQDHENITFGPHYVSKHSDASLMTCCHQYAPEHSDVLNVTFCHHYVSEHSDVLPGGGGDPDNPYIKNS